MATCWHCKDRPADPKRAKKVTLHKGGRQRSIQVPICGRCADVLRRRALAATAIMMLGVAVGTLAVVNMGGLGWALWAVAVGVAAIAAAVVWHHITDAAGYEAPDPHPLVTRLVEDGWSFGSAPAATSFQKKTCSKCGKSIPLSSHPGQRCPHCGAHWSYEHERVAR